MSAKAKATEAAKNLEAAAKSPPAYGERDAGDAFMNAPMPLQVIVSVHHCSVCHHYFRAQLPFLRPRAIYANRVVNKAVQSVYNDSMAMRRVTDRLARDFWVQPSEGMVRHWCRTYSAQFDFEVDYQFPGCSSWLWNMTTGAGHAGMTCRARCWEYNSKTQLLPHRE